MHDYYKENTRYCIIAAVAVLCCMAAIWLVHDFRRNNGIQADTDRAVDAVDSRVDRAKERINEAAGSVQQAEAAVGAAAAGIARSEKAAADITEGINSCQSILDSCIQRAGRIENILADIEAHDRKRAAGAAATDLAK